MASVGCRTMCLLFTLLTAHIGGVASTLLPGGMDARLTQAALQVVKSHTTHQAYPSAEDVPPLFSSDQLMHSNYRTKVGVSDREELQVTKLMLSAIRTDVYGAARWTHIHHNHTDHVMATTRNGVHVWRFNSPNAELRTRDAMFRFNSGSDEIVDAILFVRNEKNLQTMYLALVIKAGQTAKLVAYEVDFAGQAMLFSLPLGEVPLKIRWLQSQQEGTLVVLFPSAFADIGFTDIRQGGMVLSHIVKLHMPMATDLETTTISGYGYITVSNATTVVVYRSDELASNFRVFDILHGADLTDIALFRVGFESFLAIAGFKDQFLYVWRGGGFHLRQVFAIRDGFQWHPVALGSCRDDVLLTLATNDATYPMKLFAWSSELRQFMEIQRGTVPLGGFLALKDSLSSFSLKDNAWLFFTDALKGGAKSLMVSTKVVLLPNPVQEKGSQLVLRMRIAKEQLDQQQVLLGQASNTLRHAISSKSPVNVVRVKQVIRSVLVNGPVSMGFAKLPQGLSMEGSPVSMNKLHARMPELQRAISEIGFNLRRLTSSLKDAVFKSQPVTIAMPKIVQGCLSTQLLKTAEANLDTIQGILTTDLFRNLYWMNKPTPITGRITLARPARVRNTLQSPSINGLDLGAAVTTDRHHTLHGLTTFARPLEILKDSALEGTMNGIKLSSLVTLAGTHYVSAPKSFAVVNVVKELSAQSVDGVDIVKAVATSLNVVDDQVASGVVKFTKDVHATSVFAPVLNGIDVGDIGGRFVRMDWPASITGFKHFAGGFEARKHLHVFGRLNHLAVPQDLFLKDVEQIVKGRKSFRRLVTTVTTVDGLVDGISIPNDIYRVTDASAIDVPLAFANGIKATRDVVVAGTLDQIDLSDFASYAFKQPTKVVKTNVIFKSPVTVRKSVQVNAKVNSVLLDSLYNDAIFPTGDPIITMAGRKTFHNGAHISRMTVKGAVNGYNLLEDLMATEDHQDVGVFITGTKTLAGPVVFEKDLNSTTGIVDDVPVFRVFAGRITLHSEQNITAEPLFLDTVRVGHLYALGRIQGLSFPQDLVLKSVPQQVYGTKHMVHGLSAALLDSRIQVSVKGQVGGVDIVDIDRRRVTLSRHQVVSGPLSVGNVTMSSLNAVLMNGRPVQDFLQNVMSRTRPQVVIASKIFSGILKSSAPVSTMKGVNGVSLKLINTNAVGLRGQSVIGAPVAMKDIFVVLGKMSIRGMLDGRDLNTFEADTVPKRGWISVRGNCVFYGGLAVHGNIAAGDVNELMLSYDALLKSADQSIKGHYHFKKNVKVLGDLPHLGHINGIDLSVLDMLVAKEDRENVIHSDLDVQNVASVETDINVEGLVNGHKLRYLKDRAICHARHHDIHGTKVIRGPVEFLNSLDVRHYDNRSLSALFNDIVLLDGHFTTAPKTFNDLLLEGSIKAKHAHLKGHVNGVALDTVLMDAVWINGKCELYGDKTFKDHFTVHKNLTVLGLLNGLRVPNDLLQLCHTNSCPYQQLHSPTFDELQVPGHVPVSDLVNGHNLPQALKNTLLVHSNQTVPGTKDLQSTVFTKNVLPRRVNGASFHQEVVTLQTPQTVLSTIAPSNVIAPNVNVKGLINGIDFNQLVRDAVYLNVPQTIPAALELNTVVAEKNIKLVGTLNKVQLPQLHKDLSLFERAANQLGTVMGQKIGEHEAVLDRLSCFLTDSYSSADHFVLHQSLDVEATLVDAESNVYHLRLLDSHVGQPVAQAFHFGWSGVDQRWHLESSVTSDEGRRIYFRLEGKLLWLEEPLLNSRAKRGILTDGAAVLYNFGDVHSMSAVAADATSAIVASLTKNGVLDVFSFTLQRSEPTIIGTINPGQGAQAVKLFAFKGAVYAVVSTYDPQACLVENIRSAVYLRTGGDRWTVIQRVYGGAAIESFSKNERLYAVFTDVDVYSHCGEPSLIKVYRTCAGKSSPFELFQTLSVVSVSKLAVVHFGARLDVYMAAANHTTVAVYRLQGESGFGLVAAITVTQLTDVDLFVLEGDLYLIVAQGHSTDSTGKTIVYRAATQGAKETFRRYQLT